MKTPSVLNSVYWSLLRVWGTRISTLLVFLILARTLSPAEIGVVAYVLGWLAIFLVLADMGLAEYLVYEHAAEREMQLAVWWFQTGMAFLISTLLTLIVVFSLMPLGTQQSEVMLALIWTLPISAASKVPDALLRREFKFRETAIRSFTCVTAGGVAGVALAMSGAGVWSLVVKQWVEVLIEVVMLFRLSHWQIGFEYSFANTMKALRHSWGIVWSRFLDILMQKADTIIIGAWIGVTELGYYSVGQKMFQVLQDGFVGALTNVLSPRYGKLKENPEALKAFFLSSILGASLLVTPIFLLVSFFSPELIVILFSEKWAASAEVMRWMCLSGLLIGAVNLNGFLVLAMQKNAYFSILMSVGFVSTVVLLAAAAPFGVNAIAATLLAKNIIIFPLGLYMVMRLLGVNLLDYFSNLLPAAMVALFLTIIVLTARYGLGLNGLVPSLFVCAFSILAGTMLLKLAYGDRLKSLRLMLTANSHAG